MKHGPHTASYVLWETTRVTIRGHDRPHASPPPVHTPVPVGQPQPVVFFSPTPQDQQTDATSTDTPINQTQSVDGPQP